MVHYIAYDQLDEVLLALLAANGPDVLIGA